MTREILHPVRVTRCALSTGSPAVTYVEEREFTLRFELRCAFPDDYQGALDGQAWSAEFDAMAAEIVRAASAIVQRRRGWSVHPSNRGRPSHDEVTLVLERAPDDQPT